MREPMLFDVGAAEDCSAALASLPASSFQERIWLAERLEPDVALYNVAMAWRVKGRLDPDVLLRSLTTLIERHEILRTRFVEREGRLHQIVDAAWVPELPYEDLMGYPPGERERQLAERLRQAAHQRFDIESGRLLAAALFTVDAADQVLFLCFHHLIWDEASTHVFMRELQDYYDLFDRPALRQSSGAREGAGTTKEEQRLLLLEESSRPALDESRLTTVGGKMLEWLRQDAPERNRDDARPASPIQERLAFVDRFERGMVYPTAPVYHNLPLLLRVATAPDRHRLDAAASAIAARHEALRTTLVFADEALIQQVAPASALRAQWLDPAPSDTTPPAALLAWLRQPLDLERGPLFQIAVQPLADGTAWIALLGHLAILDRASMRTIAEELLQELSGRSAPVQGSSYAGWWRQRDPDLTARDLAFQVGHLRGDIEPLRLPERRPRAAIHVYEEGTVGFDLDCGADLQALASAQGCSLEDVLLAGFLALLRFYCGQEELVVGLMQDGRGEADAHVVGPLTDMLPLRLRVPADLTFADLMNRVKLETELIRRHHRASFDDIVRLLNPGKDMSRTALFDVLFQCAAGAPALAAGHSGAAEVVELGVGFGKFDWHLFLQPELRTGRIVYNRRIYDEPQMQLWAEHYRRLLAQASKRPHMPVSELDPLTDAERHLQLTTWNATEAAYPDVALDAIVRERAAVHPAATALTHGVERRSYHELLNAAERVARGLVAAGVRPNEMVGLWMDRGIGQVEAMLGVLMAGAAYVPIDVGAPPDRASFILADAQVRWLIADVERRDEAQRLDRFSGRVLTLPEASSEGETRGRTVPLPVVDPNAPAYCLYTSGTTGRPKGVVVTHRNVVRLIRNDRFPFTFDESDVWTLFHSYTFDFSVWELFCCLAYGGRLVIVSKAEAQDTQRFLELVRRERVTVLNQTPSAFAELLRIQESNPEELHHLRYVIFGGEMLRPRMLAPWMNRWPGVAFVNMYGITETTVHTTVRSVTVEDAEHDISNIGVPIPTTTTYLLDASGSGRLLPAGAVGELYVGGLGVAQGYLRRPDLEAQRFLPNPFGEGRLFRSGDLARYRPDGTLEIVGRADSQVKVRGYRIEPGEIESCLREHAAVADAVVLLERQDDPRLVAYVRPRGEAPTATELRAYLATKLPEFMIPAAFYSVARIPLTDHGKLDRRALQGLGTLLTGKNLRQPATPTARLLATIWSQLLGITGPGADDSFFALGGHSLLAARLLDSVSQQMGVELPLRTVFEHPGLQELADVIDEQRQRASGQAAVFDAQPGLATLPASMIQERLWFSERLDPAGAVYHVRLAWRIAGGLDPVVLGRALALLVERHEILRTRFTEDAGRLQQVVCAPWTPELERADLSGLPPSMRRDALERYLEDTMGRPIDQRSDRLLRAALVEMGAAEQVFVVCLHHLIADAGSVPAFLRELDRCYRAARDGGAGLPAPPQYREFVERQLSALRSARMAEGIEYWVRQLDGAPSFLWFPAPTRHEPHGAVEIPFTADLFDRLRRVPGRPGMSWFMAVAAALGVLLRRWTGQDDVTFGCVMAERDDVDLADVIGPCMNTIVLRSRGSTSRTVRDALAAMRDTVLDAFAHKHVPFESVVGRLNPERRVGWSPYIDVMLNVHVAPAAWPALAGFKLDAIRVMSQSHDTKFGLTVTITQEAQSIRGTLSYRGDRFARADVERMARAFARVLEQFPSRVADSCDALDLGIGPTPADAARAPSPARSQYRDFVLAQIAARDSRVSADAAEYWARQLAGAPAFLTLPTPAVPESHGAIDIPLPPDLLDRLRRVQGERDVSWFMLVAAALAALLHRWTGQDDVTFGCPIANRDDKSLADVIGPCLNTVVLRSQLEETTTLGELLIRMRETVLGAFEHGRVPFETVLDRLKPPRRPGWVPYIDVTLAPEIAAPPPTLGGLELVPHPIEISGAEYLAKFALTVGIVEVDGRLEGTLAYRGDRFTAVDARQLASLLARLLDRFATSLDEPVWTLNLIDAAERDRLMLFERGAPTRAATSIPAKLAAQCAARPNAPAVISSRGQLSFRDLDEKARRFAARLRPLVRGDEPVVALVLGRSEDLIVSMLAAWKAGCCFSPIDPEYPDARIDFILADLRPCAVVTHDASLHDRLAGTIPVLSPEMPPGEETVGSQEPLPDPDSLAYVLYTSGTTGEPKGVPIRHRNLAHFADWYIDAFDVAPGDRGSQVSSVSFDASMWEVWPTLCAGATVLPYERPAVVATELASWLDEVGVTLCFAPTVLAEALWSVGAPLPRLRWMFFAGSALTRRPPQELAGRVCNTYGPTETTIIVSSDRIDPRGTRPLNCIGRPITGAALYVLDAAGRRCPVGVPGEIHIGGAGVASGYWRRDELTRQRFLAATPDGEPGPIYRTGDIGRWMADGNLEYIGRQDRQLKISGYRVEPGEIEASLREHPLVGQALVRAVEGEVTSLAAYLVPRPGAPRDTRAVLERLAVTLPKFMIPRSVVWLDALPLSVQGKVDTNRLPKPTRADFVGDASWVEPTSALEQRIAAIWASVLQVDAVGLHDNFFDLGGNSLLLARLHARLQDALDIDVPIQALFAHATVYAFARAAESGTFTAAASAIESGGLEERGARAREARAAHRLHARR
uniref:Non-ribosomal peptide synthetase n=1 Tax=uncultured bacterium AZ_379 TaxID=1630015 RepID=A0A0E3JHW7_9BACT|nr:non-ribosomal peptide synthetase [uncultured bacterium AZ_379]